MSTEYNQIRDAYARNQFASAEHKIDVQELYQSLEDISITNEYEEDLYHLAAWSADVEAIRFLKDAGLKAGTDKYGNTALHALTKTKFEPDSPDLQQKADQIYSTATLLLELGVNPKKKNDSGKLAYFEAGLQYIYPFLKAMADAGVKMDATADEGKNLLHTLCDKLVHHKSMQGVIPAAIETVKVLIDSSGIDLEDKDIFDTTPLTYAQRSGVKEIAALLSGNADNTASGGMTIHEAVLNRDPVALEALITSGADLNEISDQYRRTPLMLACEYPSAALVELLIAGGAAINFRSGGDETAVFYLLSKAVSNFGRGMSSDIRDIVLILRSLIKKGLDLDATVNHEGDTALNVVCQAGYLAELNLKLAEELVEAGCDLNKPNASGKTPLMAFAERGDAVKHDIADLLIDNKANLAYVDKIGNTALMYAASNTNKMSARKLVSLILDQDTSTTDLVNNAGQTAMDLAVTNDNEAVVKLLLNAMV